MSEIRSESLKAVVGTDISHADELSPHLNKSKDSTITTDHHNDDVFNTNNNNVKIDINSNTPFDLNDSSSSSSISLIQSHSSNKLSDEDDEDSYSFEEGDTIDHHTTNNGISATTSFIDDGTCSRSRPYVRGQNKSGHELLLLNRSLLLSSSSVTSLTTSTSVSEKAKESLAVLNKLVLMPTPPEDTDLPALLPKHATPSDPPAEKCELEVAPVLTSESPEEDSSFKEPTTNNNKTPNNTTKPTTPSSIPLVSSLQNPVGFGNAIRSSESPLREDDSRNFPPQNEKTFSSSDAVEEKESKANTCVSPECPDKSVTSDKSNTTTIVPPTPITQSNANNTVATTTNSGSIISSTPPTSVTVSIYPTSRKGSNIPVGIAVAWQRLVTSTSSLPSNTISSSPITTMSNIIRGESPGVQKEPPVMKVVHPEPPPSPVKQPPLTRPSSASPVGRLKSNKSPSISKDERTNKVHSKSYSDKKPISHHHPFKVEGIGKSLTPDLASSPPFPLTRPLPSSSVPPNLGLPYLHNSPSSAMDSYYGGMRSVTPFPSVNNQHHLPHFPSWPSTPGTDLSSSLPQAFIGNSPYLLHSSSSSQHSMQNQMQLQHHHQMTHHHHLSSSYSHTANVYSSSYLHSGLDIFRHHYEQVLLQHSQQQQQLEFLRQYQQQHQQQLLQSPNNNNGSSSGDSLRVTSGRATPTISAGSTRNPNAPISNAAAAFLNPSSQAHTSHLSLSNHSSTTGTGTGGGHHHPNWPLESSYHHNSSSTHTLSPKSLTSSTPSPSEIGRRCPSPYPHNKTFPLQSTPSLSSSSPHIKDHRDRDASAKREHMSMSRDNYHDDNRIYEKHPPNNKVDTHHHNVGQQHFTTSTRTTSSPSSTFPNNGTHRPSSIINDRIRSDLVVPSPSPSSPFTATSPSVHKHDFTKMENLIEKDSNQKVKSDDNQPNTTTAAPIVPHHNVSPQINHRSSVVTNVRITPHHDEKVDKLHVNPSKISDELRKAADTLIETAPSTKGTNLDNDISSVKVTTISAASPKDSVKKAQDINLLTTDNKNKNGESNNVDSPNKKKRQRKSDFPQQNNNSNTNHKKVTSFSGDETKSAKKKQMKRLGDDERKHKKKPSASSAKRENYKETKVPDTELPVAALDSPGVTKGRYLHKKALPTESDKAPKTVVALLSPTKDYSYSSPMIKDTYSTPEFKCSNKSSGNCATTDNLNNNHKDSLLLNVRNTFSSDLATNDNSKHEATLVPENNNSLTNTIYAKQTTTTSKKQNEDIKATTIINATTTTVNFVNPSPMIISSKSQIISPSSPLVVVSQGESKLLSPPISSTLNSPVTLVHPRFIDSTVTVTSKILTQTSLAPMEPLNVSTTSSKTMQQQLVEHKTTLQNVNSVASSAETTALSSVSSPQSLLLSPLSCNVNMLTTTSPCGNNDTATTAKTTASIKPSIIASESFTSSSTHRPYIIGSGSLSSSPSATSKLSLPSVCTEIRRASWGGSAHNSIQKEFREDNHLDLLATVAQEFGSRDDLGKLVGSCGSGSGSNFLSPSSSSLASGSSRGSSLMPSPVHSSMQSPAEGVLLAPMLLSASISYSTGSNVNNNSSNIISNYSKSEPSSSLPTSPVPMNRIPPTLNPESCQYNKDRSNSKQNNQQNTNKKVSLSTQNGAHTKPHVWLKIPHIIPKAAAKVAEKLKKKQDKKKKSSSDETKTTSSPQNEIRDLSSQDHINSRPLYNNNNTKTNNYNSLKVDLPTNVSKDSSKHSETKQRTNSKSLVTQEELVPKLKIPKISHSFGLKKKVEGDSKEKVKKVSSKESNHHSKSDTNQSSKSMKMKLPVPKVAKLRIRLSETANPILMKESQSDTKKSKKLKIKRRHSDGDKLSHKKKHLNLLLSSSGDIPNDHHPTSSSSFPKEKANKKRKHTHDSFIYGNETSCKKKSGNKKATKIEILSPSSDLSQSFTLLTPPPTAKLLKESPPLKQERDEEETETQLQTTSNNDFSSFHLKHELGETSTSETENEPGESDTNWVSDPTFAASAIRLTPTRITGTTTTTNSNQTLIGDKKEGHSYNRITINTFTNGKESRTTCRETSKDSKPKLSCLSFRHHSLDTKKKTRRDNDYTSDDSSSSSSDQEETFHFPSVKRVKTTSTQASGTSTGGGNTSSSNRVHIKPCLKAQPVVRTVSSRSSSSEDSDEEIDLEVAALTHSITHKKPFRNPYNNTNNNKSTFTSKYTNGTSNSTTETSNSNGTILRPSYGNITTNNGNQKLDSSTSSCKSISNYRRISTNSEPLRSDEELLDIPEDFPLPPLKVKSQSTKIRRFSQSSEYDDKSKRLPVKTNLKETHRSISLSSSPTSSSTSSIFPNKAKTNNINTKSPRKRSSRSSTTSSTIISSSSSPVPNKSAAAASCSGTSTGESQQKTKKAKADVVDETCLPGNIQLESVSELLDEMRILTEIQGLFYTGKLNALQPPDVYGVTLDNERGAPPHLIFSAEEVLEKCIREKKPQSLTVGLRICAYWSPQYSGLYPGRVSTDFNPSFDPEKDLIPIEFDDGDTGMIKLAEIRLLPREHPIREYDPNPLLTLEKKHRKRRHSSANTNSGRCTGDHEEADCGESFCAKVAKYEEEDEEDDDEFKDNKPRSFKSMYWTWTGLGYKRPKSKKDRNKEFFRGIQRGDEIINVGDSAIFISHGNERPYIGRVEKFWEKKGQKVVTVRWFYHPEEVKSPKRIPHLKHPGALFESPHIDENDVQTIGRKCDVLPFPEFKERIGKMPKLSLKNSNTTKPKDLYYVAGYYDPYTYNLQLKI